MINEELLQFIGHTQKEKVLNDAAKILFENKSKKLGYLPRPAAVCLVIVKENEEIKSIGGSVPSDLILNQFGKLFALFHSGSVALRTTTLQDNTNVARTIQSSGAGNTWTNGSGGSSAQVGQGASVVARADFDIETVFANGGPEDSRQSTAIGGYNSSLGQATINTTIAPTAGTGTVIESCLFWEFIDTGPVGRIFLMSHDNISPGVAFLIAQTITVKYIWQL